MGGEQDKGRTPHNGKKYVVVEIVEPRRISPWIKIRKVSRLIFFLICAMVVGYSANTLLNPPNARMKLSEAAKTLGIPMTGKNLLGVTFVKGSPSGDTMGFTSKCPNCGYEGITLTMQYPKAPGPGWRAYDLAPEIKGILTTPTVVAMEAK